MHHKIIPVYNGSFTVKFGEFSELEVVKNTDFKIHSFIFLVIDENGEAVVVDTGFSTKNIFGFDSVYERPAGSDVISGLDAHGYNPAGIKDVILTHIHWDHTGGMEYFPEATFYAQAEDFRFLIDMGPDEDTAYYTDHWLSRLDSFHVVDGEYELKSGIRMFFSGRHSAGHQLVEVNTRDGKVILAGDENTSHKKFWESMPDEYWVKLREKYHDTLYWGDDVLPKVKRWFDSKNLPAKEHKVLKLSDIQKMGKHVLFSHDPGLMNIKSIP